MNKCQLNTERLAIRTFCENDADAYFRLLKNPQVHCFASEKLERPEDAEKEVQKHMLTTDGSQLAVALKDSDDFIGTLFGLWKGIRSVSAGIFFRNMEIRDMPLRQRRLILISCFIRRMPEGFMRMWKKIISVPKNCAESWECARRVFFWNSFRL